MDTSMSIKKISILFLVILLQLKHDKNLQRKKQLIASLSPHHEEWTIFEYDKCKQNFKMQNKNQVSNLNITYRTY